MAGAKPFANWLRQLSPVNWLRQLSSTNWLRQFWQGLRHVSGDDAYERYLAHHRLHHADSAPLDRAAWFRHEQQRKWNGVRRCC